MKSKDTQTKTPEEMIYYQPLSETYFESCNELLNTFYASKDFCNCISFSNCLGTQEEFARFYRLHPESLETVIVAIEVLGENGESDLGGGVVIGCVKVSATEYPRTSSDDFIHTPKPEEAYVSTLCVSSQARGKGVGGRLLEHAEALARKLNKKKLTLEVLNANPAERLYARFGFERVHEGKAEKCLNDFFACCLVGKREHGKYGRTKMEKTLF